MSRKFGVASSLENAKYDELWKVWYSGCQDWAGWSRALKFIGPSPNAPETFDIGEHVGKLPKANKFVIRVPE